MMPTKHVQTYRVFRFMTSAIGPTTIETAPPTTKKAKGICPPSFRSRSASSKPMSLATAVRFGASRFWSAKRKRMEAAKRRSVSLLGAAAVSEDVVAKEEENEEGLDDGLRRRTTCVCKAEGSVPSARRLRSS